MPISLIMSKVKGKDPLNTPSSVRVTFFVQDFLGISKSGSSFLQRVREARDYCISKTWQVCILKLWVSGNWSLSKSSHWPMNAAQCLMPYKITIQLIIWQTRWIQRLTYLFIIIRKGCPLREYMCSAGAKYLI